MPPQRLKVVGVFDIAEIVTPVGKGYKRLSGVPTDLKDTVVPTIKFEISFT
jgi:hypothetical protein